MMENQVQENGEDMTSEALSPPVHMVTLEEAHQAFLDNLAARSLAEKQVRFAAGPARKTLYQYDNSGRYLGEVTVAESYGGADDFGQIPQSTELKPASRYHVFDGKKWTQSGSVYQAAVEVAKQDKRVELNNMRDQKMAAGFLFMEKRFDSDTQSVQKINGAATMALIARTENQPFSMTWTTKDNLEISLNADQMIGLGVHCAAYIDRLHHQCVTIKEELMALASLKEIAELAWE